MPRISSRLIRQASAYSRKLIPLLNATRTLEGAKNELRWIQSELPRNQWNQAIARRSRLEPLQYILGSQPFGPLDIKCEPGVLIPRWETEEWASSLGEVLSLYRQPRILDACTGTGCIPLLLKHMLPGSEVHGFDISPVAVDLAKRNAERTGLSVEFKQADLHDLQVLHGSKYDIVTSNPPYIPVEDYEKPVALDGPEQSVKMYEPSLALVGHLEFYRALVENVVIPLGCRAFVFELGYEDQVEETVRLLPKEWKTGVMFDGAGKLRCVVGWRGELDMSRLVVDWAGLQNNSVAF